MKKFLLPLLFALTSPAFALRHTMRFVDPTLPCTMADLERNQKGIEPDPLTDGCVIILTPSVDSAKVSANSLFYKHQEAATWWTIFVNDKIREASENGKYDVSVDVTVAHWEVIEYLRAALHNEGYRTSMFTNSYHRKVNPNTPERNYLEIEWGKKVDE